MREMAEKGGNLKEDRRNKGKEGHMPNLGI